MYIGVKRPPCSSLTFIHRIEKLKSDGGNSIIPGPVVLKKRWIVHNEGQENGKGPQEQGGDELGNYWVLDSRRQ